MADESCTPDRHQAPSTHSSPSLYSQPGGTPDHTPRPTKVRALIENLPTGETPPRPRGDLFAEERKQREQAMQLRKNQHDSEPNGPPGHGSLLTMQRARRAQRYAVQQQQAGAWPDSTHSSASTSGPTSNQTSSGTSSAQWAASLPAGSADDVSPTFLAAMKRMSTASSSSCVENNTLRHRETTRQHGQELERERLWLQAQTHQTPPLRPRRRYSERSGPAHDPTLVSDEPPTSFSPYLSSERYRIPDEVNPYATESYGDLQVRPDTRLMGRAGGAKAEVHAAGPSVRPKVNGEEGRKTKDKHGSGISMRKSWERMREAIGLVDPEKEIAKTYVREGWEGWEEWRTDRTSGSTDHQQYSALGRPSGESYRPKEPKRDKKGSISSLFSLSGGRKPKDRRGIPPMEPLHVPADREERLAMGPTLANTPLDWKMNEGDITRLRAASPFAESLRCGAVDESARRGESPPPKDGPVRRLVRRSSGPLRRTLSKISLKFKKSTENLTGGEDFFLSTPQGLQASRPERHSCYLACTSCLREDVHKFDDCFCDCPGCRPQERRRPKGGQ